MVVAGSAGLAVTSPRFHVMPAPENVRPVGQGVVLAGTPANGKAVALLMGDSAAVHGGTVRSVDNTGSAPLSVLVLTILPVVNPN